jgi:hypothetical protein
MNSHFYLERYSNQRQPQVISLGVLSNNSFWPTMPLDVFEILVKESKFKIKDEFGQEFRLDEFHQKINYSFNSSPPVISLNALP